MVFNEGQNKILPQLDRPPTTYRPIRRHWDRLRTTDANRMEQIPQRLGITRMGEFNAPGISKSTQGKAFRFKTTVPNGIDHQPLTALLVTLEASQHYPSRPLRYQISLQRRPQHKNLVLFYQPTHCLRHRGSRLILNGHPGSASLFRYS